MRRLLFALPRPSTASFTRSTTSSRARPAGRDNGAARRGLLETEIHRTTHRFGNVVHVFSTYEMHERLDGPVIGRGIPGS